MIKKLKLKIEKHFKEVLEIKTSPHSVASGFALGTFIAILPTFGFGIFIGLAIILIFKKISKFSLLASFAVWNPAVLLALTPVSYSIGNQIFPDMPVKLYQVELLDKFFFYSRRFLIGSFILAVTLSLASYLLILILLNAHRRKKIKLYVSEKANELTS